MKNILVIVALVIVAGGAYWVFQNNQTNMEFTGKDHPADAASGTSLAGSPESGMMDTPMEGGIVDITVSGENFAFGPKDITVKKGDTVRVTFTSAQGFHDFVIDEFTGARTAQLSEGKSETIQFVADKAGTFEYYCSVGKHRSMGMVGKFVVEE